MGRVASGGCSRPTWGWASSRGSRARSGGAEVRCAEVLDDFGHVTVLEEVGRDGGDPHRVFYAAPADDRLVDRKAPPTSPASRPSCGGSWPATATTPCRHSCTTPCAPRPSGPPRAAGSSSAPRGRPAVPHDAQGGRRRRHRHTLADVGGGAALRLQDRRRPRRHADRQPHRSSHRAPRLPAPVAAPPGRRLSRPALVGAAISASFEDQGFSAQALGGLVGASLIAVVAVPPLTPALALTVVTLVAMRLLDCLLFLVHAVFVRFPVGRQHAQRPPGGGGAASGPLRPRAGTDHRGGAARLSRVPGVECPCRGRRGPAVENCLRLLAARAARLLCHTSSISSRWRWSLEGLVDRRRAGRPVHPAETAEGVLYEGPLCCAVAPR